MSFSKILSNNIKTLRKKLGQSQEMLARKSGLPRSTIAGIESGYANPGLQSVVAISKALSVSIDELITEPSPEVSLIRSGQIKRFQKSGGRVVQYKLLPDPIPGMEIDKIEISPGARLRGVPHIRGTREYLNCLKGQVTLFSEGGKYELSEGDVLSFPGDSPHSYFNPGTDLCICFSVVTLAKPGYINTES